jgi:hypothetical protein
MKADTCGRKLAGNKSLTLVNGRIVGVSGHGSVTFLEGNREGERRLDAAIV